MTKVVDEYGNVYDVPESVLKSSARRRTHPGGSGARRIVQEVHVHIHVHNSWDDGDGDVVPLGCAVEAPLGCAMEVPLGCAMTVPLACDEQPKLGGRRRRTR